MYHQKCKRTNRKRMPGGSLKHLPNPFTRLGTTFNIALRANLLRNSQTFGALHRALIHPRAVLDRLGVLSEILFARNENDGETLAKVEHFGNPLLSVSLYTRDTRKKPEENAEMRNAGK